MAERVAVWLGAWIHELGHTLFSPRPGSELWDRLEEVSRTINPAVFKALNLAEDQRQERAVIGRFPASRGYLTAIVVHAIIRDGSGRGTWPLLAGRTWIPSAARALAKRYYTEDHGPEQAEDVADLIGHYQTLSDPSTGDVAEAVKTITALARILYPAGAATNDVPDTGCGGAVSRPAGDAIPAPVDNDLPTAATAEDVDPEDTETEDVDHGPGITEDTEDTEQAEDGAGTEDGAEDGDPGTGPRTGTGTGPRTGTPGTGTGPGPRPRPRPRTPRPGTGPGRATAPSRPRPRPR